MDHYIFLYSNYNFQIHTGPHSLNAMDNYSKFHIEIINDINCILMKFFSKKFILEYNNKSVNITLETLDLMMESPFTTDLYYIIGMIMKETIPNDQLF